jgi:DNA repair protein RadC
MLVKENPSPVKHKINNKQDVFNLFVNYASKLDREVFICIHLDNSNHVISVEEVSQGILNASIVHPREVFKSAILSGAASVILTHNHPSNNPKPSSEDFEITKRLVQAGKLIGIEVLDHVILTDDHPVSIIHD